MTSPRLERTPSWKATDMMHGMPYSRDRIPRWLSGAPCSVMTPLTPEVRAGVRNVVVPPRATTIDSVTRPPATKSSTACGESSHTTGPSVGSSLWYTDWPVPTSLNSSITLTALLPDALGFDCPCAAARPSRDPEQSVELRDRRGDVAVQDGVHAERTRR